MKTPKANSPWTRRIGAVFAVALLAARVSSVRAHPSPRDVEDERDPIPTNPREPLDLKKLFQDGILPLHSRTFSTATQTPFSSTAATTTDRKTRASS